MCALPVAYAGFKVSKSKGTIPGPWAASNSTSTFLDCNSDTISSKGNLIPVGLVTVSIKANLVFGVT